MRVFFTVLLFFLSNLIFAVQWDTSAQFGKRWSEMNERVYLSNQSYSFALHANLKNAKQIHFLFGPSYVFDFYTEEDLCETRGCFSQSHHKIGIDFGSGFVFEGLTLFALARVVLHGRGNQTLSGKSRLVFPASLKLFDNGTNEGELISRTLGYDLIFGAKWSLIDQLFLTVSFENAYEKNRIIDGEVQIRNGKGDELTLNSSMNTEWIRNNSSAFYFGLAYTI